MGAPFEGARLRACPGRLPVLDCLDRILDRLGAKAAVLHRLVAHRAGQFEAEFAVRLPLGDPELVRKPCLFQTYCHGVSSVCPVTPVLRHYAPWTNSVSLARSPPSTWSTSSLFLR